MKNIFGLILIFPMLILLAGCGTSLTQVAKEGDIAAIQKLLDQGANINEGGIGGGAISGSPLSYAAYHCRIEAVKYLIHKGADINNATGYTGYGYSGGGLRPLHMAASSGCTEAIKLLLDAGADIDVRANKKWWTALAIAAYDGHTDIVDILVDRGANIDIAIKNIEFLKGRVDVSQSGIAYLLKLKKKAYYKAELKEVEAKLREFEAVARKYREAKIKPSPPEEARKFMVQAESAFDQQRLTDAVDLYTGALKLCPWWPQAHYNRAMVLSLLGDNSKYKEAIMEMKKYLMLVPDAPNARTAQDNIYKWESMIK